MLFEDIYIADSLVNAIKQRVIEKEGLLALLRFAFADNPNYQIPEDKQLEIKSIYTLKNIELNLLKDKVTDSIPADILPFVNEWAIDFESNKLIINQQKDKDSINKDYYKNKRSSDSYDDTLFKMYEGTDFINGRKTLEATFQVTEACTLVCKYCYQHNKTPKVMTLDVAKKYIDRIFEEYKDTHYCIVLSFIGGEPLLQPKLISDIVDYWDYKCIMENLDWGMLSRFTICTNGTEYRTKESQDLINKLGNRLSFTVSIDGNKELHDSARIFPDGRGSYDLAIDAAEDFEKRFSEDLGSKMTIAPSNINFLFPAIKHYLSKGKTLIHANCVYEEGWTYEHGSLFYKELKKVADYLLDNYPHVYLSLFDETLFEPMDPTDDQNWCGGNGLMLACDPEGILYPCLRYMPSSLGDNAEPLTCGHVDTGIEVSILEEMQKITRRSQSTDECFNCPIAQGCSWCTAYNYEVFGTINKRATFICPMHKARALANVYYWNKFYKKYNIDKVKENHCPKEWALELIDENEYEMLNNLALRD